MNPNDAAPRPQEGENKFLSDTQKLVHRHLQDPDHQFTEEEIAAVRIGMTPPDTIASADNPNEKVEEEVKEISEELEESGQTGDEKPPQDDRITPWDLTT